MSISKRDLEVAIMSRDLILTGARAVLKLVWVEVRKLDKKNPNIGLGDLQNILLDVGERGGLPRDFLEKP